MMEHNIRSAPYIILLWIVTCGIYGYIWIYETSTAIRDYTGDTKSLSPGVEVLLCLVTCGLYSLYWFYNLSQRMEACSAIAGLPPKDNSLIYLLLSVFGMSVVAAAIAQGELNRIWEHA